MKQLYVKLSTPIIELSVKSKDASGTKDSMLVGFKRYKVEDSQKQLKQLQHLLEAQVESIQDTDEIETTELDLYIASQIVYIKQANLVYIEDGKETTLQIPDTRKAKPIADLWEGSDECLSVLVDLYLSSSPTRSALTSSLQHALVNSDFDNGELKN
jgi:hypothetical protein